MAEPIDRHGKFRETRCVESRCGYVARQKCEAFLFQTISCRRGAAIPRRSEDRFCNWSQQVRQQCLAGSDVCTLDPTRTTIAKLTLPSSLFMVHVRVAVLVNR